LVSRDRDRSAKKRYVLIAIERSQELPHWRLSDSF
jgi:hypothetical protein